MLFMGEQKERKEKKQHSPFSLKCIMETASEGDEGGGRLSDQPS